LTLPVFACSFPAGKYLTYVALTGVSDPMEVAYDLRMLSGTAAPAE
jgi:hypothetical protein